MMLLRVFGRACEDWLCFKKDACSDVVEDEKGVGYFVSMALHWFCIPTGVWHSKAFVKDFGIDFINSLPPQTRT
jgi:hypothetical protein